MSSILMIVTTAVVAGVTAVPQSTVAMHPMPNERACQQAVAALNTITNSHVEQMARVFPRTPTTYQLPGGGTAVSTPMASPPLLTRTATCLPG